MLVAGARLIVRPDARFSIEVLILWGAESDAERRQTRAVPVPHSLSAYMRVLIADDDRLFAELLRDALTAHDDVEVVGIARDGVEALDLVQELEPDLLLMDVAMPRADGIETTQRVTGLANAPRVVLITGSDSPPPTSARTKPRRPRLDLNST